MPATYDLTRLYEILNFRFGHQHWWPGETKDEIIIGAILTQSVSWQNVEKAIENLKREKLCSLKAIHNAEMEQIIPLIKSTLYYNQKAKKLKNFCNFLFGEFDGKLAEMFTTDLPEIRNRLLQINGIGAETADSILLYAGELPVFVIDAYTRRIFSRLGSTGADWSYQQMQDFFSQNLPHEVDLFQDYHAQIVKLGKDFCRKRQPLCEECPLHQICRFSSNYYS